MTPSTDLASLRIWACFGTEGFAVELDDEPVPFDDELLLPVVAWTFLGSSLAVFESSCAINGVERRIAEATVRHRRNMLTSFQGGVVREAETLETGGWRVLRK